jgi:hypothetical protein
MEALARRHIPNFRIAVKADVLWMRALGMVLWPLVPDFGSAFTTVIGSTVYLPRPKEAFSPDGLAATLAHELVHQLDQREFGLAFYTSYLLTPLPVGRTTRAHWERRAYAVDLMLALERGGPECLAETLDRLVALFSGPSYAWMWAGKESARAYLAPLVAEVESGALQKRAPYDEILATWLAGA